MVDLSDIRILIVDDNEISIMVLHEMLKSYAFTVDLARGGKEAISLAGKTKYNLIFMDYMMPELDGIETTAYIRKTALNEQTPIIVLSGSTDSTDIKRYIEGGMNDYIAKPVDAKEMQCLIYKWIPGVKALSENRDVLLIKGIDTALGMDNFGNNLFYFIEILKMFCKNSNEKIKEITEFLSKRNYNGYTVEVHGLKGEAAIIGATELALLAKELEVAGKVVQGIVPSDIPIEKNLEFIEVETKNLIDLYLCLTENIRAVIGGCDEEDYERAEQSEPKDANNEIIDKAKRYINHAIESIKTGDTELAIQWLTEVIDGILTNK